MPLVYRNAEGEVCVEMSETMYRAQCKIAENFIFDTTPYAGKKTINGAFPQMNSDRFCTDLSSNITAEVFIEMPQEMLLLYQSGMVIPDKFYVLQNEDDLLIVYFGKGYKVTGKTKVPKDSQMQDPTDKDQQRMCLDYMMYELTAQGFQAQHELRSSLFFVLDYVSYRLSVLAKQRKKA